MSFASPIMRALLQIVKCRSIGVWMCMCIWCQPQVAMNNCSWCVLLQGGPVRKPCLLQPLIVMYPVIVGTTKQHDRAYTRQHFLSMPSSAQDCWVVALERMLHSALPSADAAQAIGRQAAIFLAVMHPSGGMPYLFVH